jgi:hypothetical protein
MCLVWLLHLNKHLYLSDMWLGVAPRIIFTKKNSCSNETGLHAQNMITITSSIKSILLGWPMWPLNEHVSLHFDNE